MNAWILARNTFREAIRDRLLATVLLFGAMFVGASVLVAPLTLGEHARVVRDLGLSAIALFSMLLIVTAGTGLVFREIERKTIHTILTQPVSRASFILGKFAGLYSTVALAVGMLGVLYVGVVAVFGGGLQAALFTAIALVLLEAAVMTAIAVFFSSVASPLLSALFTVFLYVAGNLASDLQLLTKQFHSPVIDGLRVVVPALQTFHVRNNLLAGTAIGGAQMGYAAGYAVFYTAAVLLVTVVAFSRRDFD
jgi:ABC-type transport system involved in multi-copper enzyme maturation permease subunit